MAAVPSRFSPSVGATTGIPGVCPGLGSRWTGWRVVAKEQLWQSYEGASTLSGSQ